jgi:ERCC4-related helicase
VLQNLLLARKRIIHKAENKLDTFKAIINDELKKRGNLKYSLVYVPEGCSPDSYNADIFDDREEIQDDAITDKLIDRYTKIVMESSNTITVQKFTSDSTDRENILSKFANGDIQVLTSMKCLDEGVDVPRSELAIFCASTGNPRQFIQRRGRILRQHEDKQFATIHDLVVVPYVSSYSASYTLERNLLKIELKRVRDFAQMSLNASYTQFALRDVMDYYKLNLYNND